jgi:hypothetical protein
LDGTVLLFFVLRGKWVFEKNVLRGISGSKREEVTDRMMENIA